MALTRPRSAALAALLHPPSPPPFPHSAFFKLSSSCSLSFSFSPDNDNRRKKHNYNKLDNNNNNNRKNNKLHLVIQTTCHITNKQRVKTHHMAWVSLAFPRPYRRAASVAHFWVKLQRQRTVGTAHSGNYMTLPGQMHNYHNCELHVAHS